MKKKVTIKTLATTLGVSVCTINKALYGKPKVSEETRKKVIALAKKLGYEPNYAAQAMAKGISNVGIVYNSTYDTYCIPIVNSIEKALEALKYMRFEHTTVDTSIADNIDILAENILNIAKKAKIMVFIVNEKILDKYIQDIINSTNLPVILVGENLKYVKNVVSIVSQNSKISGYIAADLLNALGAKENLIVTTGMISSYDHMQKVITFKERSAQLGVKNIEILEIVDNPNLQYKLVKEIIHEKEISGIYASTDIIEGICNAIKEMNTKNIKVISTGNFAYIKKMMSIGIIDITIDQALAEQGIAVVKAIENYFRAKEIEKYTLVTPIIKTISMIK